MQVRQGPWHYEPSQLSQSATGGEGNKGELRNEGLDLLPHKKPKQTNQPYKQKPQKAKKLNHIMI